MCDSTQVTTPQSHSNHRLLQAAILSTFYPLDNLPTFFITSWVFPFTLLRFDLVITPTSSSSSARLLTFTITPSLTSSHTASLQRFKCHHPSNSPLTALNVFPLSPSPRGAACCVLSVSSLHQQIRLCVHMFDQTLWRRVWNLWLIPLSSQMNPLNCARLLVLAGLRNNFTLLLPLPQSLLSHSHTVYTTFIIAYRHFVAHTD